MTEAFLRGTTGERLRPAVDGFVRDVRALLAEAKPEDRWEPNCERIRARFQALLSDSNFKAHAESWPDSMSQEGKPGNLHFYEDPDFGFTLDALVRGPGIRSSIHDHGKTWTFYGVLAGGERLKHFTAKGVAPGELPSRAEIVCDRVVEAPPGYVECEPPWRIHAEYNGPDKTISVIMRSQKSGPDSFVQNRYDPEGGGVSQYYGPKQIPFTLA